MVLQSGKNSEGGGGEFLSSIIEHSATSLKLHELFPPHYYLYPVYKEVIGVILAPLTDTWHTVVSIIQWMGLNWFTYWYVCCEVSSNYLTGAGFYSVWP